MKKATQMILGIVLITCLVGLIACGKKNEETNTPPITTKESEDTSKLSFHTTEAVGNQEYVVIQVDFPDLERDIDEETLSERMLWFLNEYFYQASYEKLKFEGTMVGPYTLPNPVEDYSVSPRNFEVDRSRVLALVNDAINLADDDVEFSEDLYVMISLGATGLEYGMIGYCAVPGMLGFATDQPPTTDSGEVVANAVVFCQNAHLGTYIHDTLHMLGGVIDGQRVTPCLYDHELQAKYVGGEDQAKIAVNIGFWDPLSSHWPYERELPPTGLISWTKLRLNWIDPDQIAMIYPGETVTVRLDPLVGDKSDTLVIKIPLTEHTYYLLENRQAVDSDAFLPADGVLLLYVDESIEECRHGQAPVKIVDANPSVPYLNDAAFDIGAQETYIDTENNLAIVLLKKEGQSYQIQITTPEQVEK